MCVLCLCMYVCMCLCALVDISEKTVKQVLDHVMKGRTTLRTIIVIAHRLRYLDTVFMYVCVCMCLCALDNFSDRIVQQSLDHIMKGRTTIVLHIDSGM
jgi:ABC-type multidrug transport system fused ATPase/permease subunit